MASQRVNDFVVKGFGGHGAGEIAEFPGVFDFIDRAKYEAAKTQFGAARTLTCIKANAGDNIDTSVDQVLDIIKKKTGGRLATIGSFCALGASNSCALVLALAAKLKRLGAPPLSYLGLVDLPMFPFGRDPRVTDIGLLRPINRPVYGVPAGQYPLTMFPPYYPRTLALVPPHLDFSAIIDAQTKRNFYQTEGNHWKLVSETPPPFNEYFSRWWTSEMPGEEVHGTLIGWNNVPAIGAGQTDTSKHIGFCNRDDTWGEAQRDAAKALTQFPP